MSTVTSPNDLSETADRSVQGGERARAVDLLRGLVMILMTLDHVRDYFGNVASDPTNLASTTPALFFTRWITHFCAPAFFLLTGTSAFLSGRRTGPGALARYLATRGLWLIVLETIVMRCLAWQWNFDFRVTLLFVLWALGWSMIVLAALVRWPVRVVAAFGIALVVGHNALDGVNAQSLGALAPFWLVLHQPGLLVAGPERFVLVAYPLVPWIGVTAIGYALGSTYGWERTRRITFLRRAGAVIVAAFLVLRLANVYGDPRPWGAQPSPLFTILSFLNTTKYPPSLLFLCMTLGPALLFLASRDGATPRPIRWIERFGRVPLFYFVAHIVLIHLLTFAAAWWRYGEVHWVFESPTPDRFPFTQPPGWDLGLPVVYAVWGVVVALLWPACRWYDARRSAGRTWWMRYL